MSKKSRHKKKNKQKLQKKFEQVNEQIDTGSGEIVEDPKISDTQQIIESKPETTESESIIDQLTKKLISKDVRMIIFTIIGLALVLVAIKIFQQKTGYIDSFGEWLYKITNIQTM